MPRGMTKYPARSARAGYLLFVKGILLFDYLVADLAAIETEQIYTLHETAKRQSVVASHEACPHHLAADHVTDDCVCRFIDDHMQHVAGRIGIDDSGCTGGIILLAVFVKPLAVVVCSQFPKEREDSLVHKTLFMVLSPV